MNVIMNFKADGRSFQGQLQLAERSEAVKNLPDHVSGQIRASVESAFRAMNGDALDKPWLVVVAYGKALDVIVRPPGRNA